uniref:RVT_2 domain-containing protein n=1 Tax=Tanacetum cinerariifolium TaxID=118510 RepID=A0A6L2KAT7_TANCI|nr:RVT_2 domain-containing protein [Tanacetum cinerariifolium]
MKDEIFFTKSKYIKKMLKKFKLEHSTRTKTPMSTEIKLSKDDEAESVEALNIEKQTALAISMTEAEYDSARKACQQALWLKQALIDYDIRLDDEDDGDTFDMWDITVEDVEQIRQFLTPNVLKIIEDVIQPLILTTLHTTPLNEDYVAPATKPILDELLEDNILNVAMVDEEADPTRDLEEPKRLLVEDPHFT